MSTPPVTPLSNAQTISSPLKLCPIHLILDFDGTITTEDTTSILCDVARRILTKDRQEQQNHLKLWESCVAKYHSAIQSRPDIKALRERRKTINDEIEYQYNLRAIEAESVSRVGESGLFKGVAPWAWREAGWRECQNSTVRITAGFQELVETVQRRAGGTGRWGVVSVNWSRDFLKGVLGFALASDTKSEWVPVLSNHFVKETGFIAGPKFGPVPRSGLAMESQPVCRSRNKVEDWNFRQLQTLNNAKLILSSGDKVEAMISLRDSFQGSAHDRNRTFLQNKDPFEKPSEENPLVVYVGDSATDIECLLEADIGIVMSSYGASPLMKTLRQYSISVRHLSFWEPQKGNSIWFATDFRDMISCKLFAESAPPLPMYGERSRIQRWINDSQETGV